MAVEWRVLVADPAGEAGSVWAPDPDPLLWDIGLWSGEVPSWTDFTQFVESFRCRRGRRRLEDEMSTGEALIVLHNDDGIFNPYVGSSPARPGRWIQIEGRVPGGTPWLPQWRGFIDSIQEIYLDGGSRTTMALSCLDFLAQFNQTTRPALATPIGAGDLTSARVAYLLDELFWPAGIRDISIGRHSMIATELGRSFLAELRAAAAADGDGGIWIGRDGDVVFPGGLWRSQPESATAQFGIGGVADALQIGGQPDTDWALRRVVNDAIVYQRNNPTPARAQSTQSIGLYGTLAREATVDTETIAQAQTLADEAIANFQWDALRVTRFEATPISDSGIGALLGLELLWRIELEVRLLAGWQYIADVYVNEITIEGGVGDPLDSRWFLRVDQADNVQP